MCKDCLKKFDKETVNKVITVSSIVSAVLASVITVALIIKHSKNKGDNDLYAVIDEDGKEETEE